MLCPQELPLCNPHKPNDPAELARIEAANGWITEERELFMGQLHRMDLDDPTILKHAEEVVQWVRITNYPSRINSISRLRSPECVVN